MACLLADRLRPDSVPPAVHQPKDSISSTSAVSAAAADPALWRSDALDHLAESLASSPELLGAEPAAGSLLGRLLAGAGPLPLLREPAALAALERLQQLLRAPADQPGGGPSCDPA